MKTICGTTLAKFVHSFIKDITCEKSLEEKNEEQECLGQRLNCENSSLKFKIDNWSFDISSFQGNDRKVCYYTGLPSFITLIALYTRQFMNPVTKF